MSIVIQSISTVVLFIAFIALWSWAWRKERGSDYAAASKLPLEESSSSTASRIDAASVESKR